MKSIAGLVAAAVAVPAAILEANPVVTQNRKLKAVWSMEAAQDLKAMHNLEAEAELTRMLAAEINKEIDAEILQSLRQAA